MRDLKRYWQEVRALQRELPDYVWVVADDTLVEVGAEVASRLLHAKSHRLATEDEVTTRQIRESASNRELDRQRLRRQGIGIVTV